MKSIFSVVSHLLTSRRHLLYCIFQKIESDIKVHNI